MKLEDVRPGWIALVWGISVLAWLGLIALDADASNPVWGWLMLSVPLAVTWQWAHHR